MRLLLVGAAIVYAGLLAWALIAGLDWIRYEQRSAVSLALTIFLAPTAAFWVGAEAANALRPTRTLDRRLRFPIRRLASGIIGGAIAAALAAIGLAFLDEFLPDALITVVPAALMGLIVVSTMPRSRQGRCWSCGYDLSGATPAMGGTCPECGAAVMKV